MKRELSFTVCLASYNGEKYIRQQVNSILAQLIDNDELIVSDDGSTDHTLEILNEIQKAHCSLKIVNGPHMGFSCNFGNAAKYAKGDIILFSDQDDLWCEEKTSLIYNCFMENIDCTTVLHKMKTFRENEEQDTKEITVTYHPGVITNFTKSSYWGCCMAVRRDFLNRFLPFRDYCVGHDQLIGLMSEKYGKTCFLNKELIKHRLHNNNTSNRRTIKEMILFRKELIKDFYFAEKCYLNFERNHSL